MNRLKKMVKLVFILYLFLKHEIKIYVHDKFKQCSKHV